MAKLYPFSEQTRQLLENIPQQGETHRWLAKVAGGLRPTLSKEACFAFLRACCDEGVRHREVPDKEIAGAVELAYGEGVESANAGRGSLCWPAKDDGLIAEVLGRVSASFSVEEDTGLGAADVLPGLFAPGELVCAGASSDRPVVRPVEGWLEDADRMQLICVNPMRGSYGKNKAGDVSVRCQDNVRSRRYLVAEFDDAARSKAEQACLIAALARLAPLVVVVDSGGKSLHAWFRVEELGTKDQVRFFAACCAVGADKTRWDICGWLRMPGGWRPGKSLSQRHGGTEDDGGSQQGAGSGEQGSGGVRQRILFAALPQGEVRGRRAEVRKEKANAEHRTLNIERRKEDPLCPSNAEIRGPVGKAGER